MKYHENPCSGNRVHIFGEQEGMTDGQRGFKRVTGAFCDYASAANKLLD